MSAPSKRTPRETAIETLAVVIARLKGPAYIDDLERKQLAVACEHAREAVEQIEETKRPRRAKLQGQRARSEVPTEEDR